MIDALVIALCILVIAGGLTLTYWAFLTLAD